MLMLFFIKTSWTRYSKSSIEHCLPIDTDTKKIGSLLVGIWGSRHAHIQFVGLHTSAVFMEIICIFNLDYGKFKTYTKVEKIS